MRITLWIDWMHASQSNMDVMVKGGTLAKKHNLPGENVLWFRILGRQMSKEGVSQLSWPSIVDLPQTT